MYMLNISLEEIVVEKLEYNKLDIKKLLETKPTVIGCSKEALKDVIPIQWSDDVLSGKVKVIISDKR